MVLVDTPIWSHHFRKNDARLVALLQAGSVAIHAAVVGELLLGNLPQRDQTRALLKALPRAASASDEEVFGFIQAHALHSRGIGWVDAHLLASARLGAHQLWTADRPLIAAALHVRVPTYSA